MLTFNHVLSAYGIAVEHVQLVRHQDKRQRGRSVYSLWRSEDPAFEQYQSVQGPHPLKRNGGHVFDIGGWIAAFVVDHQDATLFAGFYRVDHCGPCPPDDICPIRGLPHGPGNHLYTLNRESLLDDLRGRLAVNWGPGFRSWIQRAARQAKPIIEIRRTIEDPPFPGFLHFRHTTDDISSLPNGWKDVLRSSSGVYLLVDEVDGKQYVGSATGADGFLGRFLAYEQDGHGGNVLLRAAARPFYRVSILETTGTNVSRDEVIKLEELWKNKLGSRSFGLNHDPKRR